MHSLKKVKSLAMTSDVPSSEISVIWLGECQGSDKMDKGNESEIWETS